MTTERTPEEQELETIVISIAIPAVEGDEDNVLQTVKITPGATCGEILNALGRDPSGHILATLSGKVFAPFDAVFPHVQQGDKLYLTPNAKAGAAAPAPHTSGGAGMLGRLKRLFGERRFTEKTTTPVLVTPKVLPAWRQKGWKQVSQGVYEGFYATPYGTRKGRVVFQRDGSFRRVLIWDPPKELKLSGHPHAICFTRVEGNVFEIHQSEPPVSLDSAILTTERLFQEAHEMLGKPRRS